MKNRSQQGVVSLFVVMFTTILLTVVAVGFLRLMVQEQKQATNQDLSQSAYDSAMSGVEDAKRVLSMCAQGTTEACDAIRAGKCDTVAASTIVSKNGESTETIISSNGSSTKLNQGYTCVIISPQSQDFVGNILEGESHIVALKAVGAGGIKKITVEWMHKNNDNGNMVYAGGGPDTIEQPTVDPGTSLPKKSDWNSSAPSLLRVQAVLPPRADQVDVADLDGKYSSTVYLRPSLITFDESENPPYTLPTSRAASSGSTVASSPRPVNCSGKDYANGSYACKVTLVVPDVVPLGSNVAFLRLTSLYRDTSFRVTLESDTGSLMFDGVQPVVDSTGRASNLYRRVSSRLNMSQFIVPPAAISVTGSICKDFYVTDTEAISSSSMCRTNIVEPEITP